MPIGSNGTPFDSYHLKTDLFGFHLSPRHQSLSSGIPTSPQLGPTTMSPTSQLLRPSLAHKMLRTRTAGTDRPRLSNIVV
jgi:hypothetical protein